MTTSPVTLLKGDNIDLEADYRDALPVNMYVVEKPILGAAGYLKNFPGLLDFAEGEGFDRGATYNEVFLEHYRLSGEKLLKISAAGLVTELGEIPGTKQARLKDFYSFNTQGIIADGKFYLYAPLAGLNQVTDPDVGAPIDGVWVDGYYFMTDGRYLFHTDIDDETSIDPLKFATAEFMPDPSLGLAKTQDNKVVVFGRYTIEYFINVATENFAFQRVATRAQKIGIVSTHAKCEVNSNFYIVGGPKNASLGVYSVSLGSIQKVSTREVDKVLALYSEDELSDLRLETVQEENTAFVLIHLPKSTLCFNETVSTSIGYSMGWSELKTGVATDNPYRAINGIFDARLSMWIFGDRLNNSLGALSESVFSQYDEIQEWILKTPFLKLEGSSIDEIELESIASANAENESKIALSFTYDGVTYSAEAWDTYGIPFKHNLRVIFRRLGYVSDWVGIKFRGTSKAPAAFSLMTVTYG